MGTKPLSPPVPEGYTAKWDSRSKEYYFVHDASGRSTRTLPLTDNQEFNQKSSSPQTKDQDFNFIDSLVQNKEKIAIGVGATAIGGILLSQFLKNNDKDNRNKKDEKNK
ncbi:uncharacterized protein ASCRUDRAFT_10381 [Ascoidea rubescens DSM 1968]|uniref:WW domain-containing protein n=1 Tax=Ascoidea rubescens DSM 1968 TaxID=1344418 RepID=A0A1D2V9M1_9ASCO|nr:hypothetical protein ASCRUDRAFT_10381 [Ascoidea rubescens DSM 1968]ODV58351.1 hypothetical protein ASCRUDRAFT_10381 [Ascoidea rubescens DSM 1968]